MLTTAWPFLAVIGEALLKIILISFILVRRQRAAATNLAWIVIILAVPLIGAVAYLLVGEARLSRKRIRRHAEILHRLTLPPSLSSAPEIVRAPAIPPVYRPIATLAEAVGLNDAVGGNRLRLIGDAEQFVASLVEDIDAARNHCHLLFYIYLEDRSGKRVAEALMRAVGRGVACRLLVDAVGSRPFARSDLRAEMEQAGVTVVEALPANAVRMLFARLDLRNHRKIVIIDGAISYMGSQNIADAEFALKPKFAPWIDAAVRAVGPVTRHLQTLFVEDWFLDTNESLESVLSIVPPVEADGIAAQIMGTGPNSYNEAMRQLTLTAFQTAREELIVTTPYFVPDDATAAALRTAARRGVETILIVPARNDSPLVAAASRSHYESLLDAGVQIHEFQKGLLHAKTMTIDRSLALISTANLDRRSFELNFEVSMVVYDTDFASELRFLQSSYRADAEPVEYAQWIRRGWPQRLWQNFTGTLSPIL